MAPSSINRDLANIYLPLIMGSETSTAPVPWSVLRRTNSDEQVDESEAPRFDFYRAVYLQSKVTQPPTPDPYQILSFGGAPFSKSSRLASQS